MNKDSKPVCLRLPKEWICTLGQIAREKSYKENKNIKWNDLVKIALKEKWGLK